MKIINEAVDPVSKIIKAVLGSSAVIKNKDDVITGEWIKIGGYADKTFEKMEQKLKELKFKKGEYTSVMGQAGVAVNTEGWVLKTSEFIIEASFKSSYGNDKSSNRHYATLIGKFL